MGKISCIMLSSLFMRIANASIDFNGDGVSDLWEQEFRELSPGESDFDGDGASDREEGIAGTDPEDRASVLALAPLRLSDEKLIFQWAGVAGKSYRIERLAGKSWIEVVSLPPLLSSAIQEFLIEAPEGGIFRLGVSDVDGDRDGLSAWEESQLGWSDDDPSSADDSERLDYISAIRAMEGPAGLPLGSGEILPQKLPSRNEAARFLIQASFGPTDELITEVTEMGISGWFDAQLAAATTTTTNEMYRNQSPFSAELFRQGWWRVANIAPDQLRHRMAYALSQIFVVSFQGGNIVNNGPRNQSIYYDIFVNGAFGSYRNILEKVTYSMVMGNYLSHLNNRKSDPTISRFPDENFAREVMQLFTIGLWELNPDGTFVIDQEGNLVPTYDNDTIVEMAKVFTGLSNSTYNFFQPAEDFFDIPRGNDYERPMKMFEDQHEPGVKNIINGVILDGTMSGEEEVQATLDALVSHPNLAPFVSRLLIQRFTSSNPSREYLARVTSVWNESVPQTLERVLEAILFDPEVRNTNPEDVTRGKVREPILRYTHLFRALRFADPTGRVRVDSAVVRAALGQFPMMAPSVFNFYLPDFSPPGELRTKGLVAPEMQIGTASQLVLSDNRFRAAIDRGATFMVPDFSVEEALASDPEALVAHLDTLMTGGRLTEATKRTTASLLRKIGGNLSRAKIAVHLISQSMEFTTIE
jgi:uncharacterized protein (DUF1800 family)